MSSSNKPKLDPTTSHIEGIQDTFYSNMLDEKRCYRVYVFSNLLEGNFHRSIVLKEESEHLGIVLGLTLNDGLQIVAESGIFQGSNENLDYKGTVTTTLRSLAELATEILLSMETYNLLWRNCQNFCNTFLFRISFDAHDLTDPWIFGGLVSMLSTVAVVVVVAVIVINKLK